MLKISQLKIKEILRQAKETLPYETCGILSGKKREVVKVYKMTNIAKQPETCYLMNPKEQLRVIKEIRNEGLEMIGIYHSHPDTEAYPSKRDVKLAFYPEASYVIISFQSVAKPVIRAFRLKDETIQEEEIIS